MFLDAARAFQVTPTKIECRAQSESNEVFDRAEAAQRLQSRNRLRGDRVATDAGRESDFSVLRNSELGGAACCSSPYPGFPDCARSRLGFRSDARRFEANGMG